MKKKRKINKKHCIITLAILIALFICVYKGISFIFQEKLEILGDQKMTLMLHSPYIEYGTNIKDVKIEGEVNTNKAGQYQIHYTYQHQNVVREVEVLDNQQIVMNLNGDQNTYVKQGQPYIESGCHVIDQDEGDLTKEVQIKGEVDTSKIGDYEIIYTVENKNHIICAKKRIVHVVSEKDFIPNTKGIPVLMYHYVYTKNDLPKQLNTNYIEDTKLEEQLKYLKQENYYFPSYQELSAYIHGKIDLPQKSVILTFDDGQKGFLEYGIPLLEKYQIPATSFLISSKDGDKTILRYASEYISFQSHSYDMHKGGGTIGHGGIISALNTEQITEDLLKAQKIVQNSEAFAYPYGDVTSQAQVAIKKANILCAFTTQYGKVKKGDDPTKLKRVRVLGDGSLQSYMNIL